MVFWRPDGPVLSAHRGNDSHELRRLNPQQRTGEILISGMRCIANAVYNSELRSLLLTIVFSLRARVNPVGVIVACRRASSP